MHRSASFRTVEFALIALLLAMLPGSFIAANPRASQTSDYALYTSIGDAPVYHPLDPQTLEDLSDAAALTFTQKWPQVEVSTDGSTMVELNASEGSLDNWIVVRDGIGGAQRTTITPEKAVFDPQLSADGSRLIVSSSLTCGPSGCGERIWYAYDTRSGELVSTTQDNTENPVWPGMIDPDAKRLYTPFHERTPTRSSPATPGPTIVREIGPWPLQIAAWDLESGAEIERMTVPGVLAGSWQVDSIDDMYVSQMLLPAIALAPDGSRIAVIDAAVETLTLIDPDTLDVVETYAIHKPRSFTHRLLDVLGIAPQEAQAKVSQGRSNRAAFSADGRHLYLSGYEMDIGDTVEEINGHGLGLTRIDVSSGEITAEVMVGDDAEQLIPAPDGRSLYLVRSTVPWWDNEAQVSVSTYQLMRLDAESLETQTERTFPGWSHVMLVHLPPGP